MKIAAILPAYNEASFLPGVLAAIPTWVNPVWVIDDASTDGTSERVRPPVVLLRNQANLGVGLSVVRGYRLFLESDADIAVTMDADGQMDPRELIRIAGPIAEGRADYVKGDRISGNGHGGTMPAIRRVANAGLSVMTHFVGGTSRLADTQCGYTAISRSMLDRLNLDAIAPRYGYVNDVLFQVTRLRGRILSVPVRGPYGSERSDIRMLPTCLGLSRIFLRGFLQRALAL